jgi:hypothetical protein
VFLLNESFLTRLMDVRKLAGGFKRSGSPLREPPKPSASKAIVCYIAPSNARSASQAGTAHAHFSPQPPPRERFLGLSILQEAPGTQDKAGF